MSQNWRVTLWTVLVVGVLSAGMWFAIAWVAADAILNPAPPREQPFLAEQLIAAQAVEFPARDGVRVGGLWVSAVDPAGLETLGAVRRPVIVLLHGYGETRDTLLPHAELYANAGYHALLIDFRGHGTSSGEVAALGTLDEADVLGAIDYIHTRGDADVTRIGVQGISMGAAAGIMAAARDERIDAVIAEEPVSSLRDAAWTSYRERLQLPAVLFRDVTLAIVERRLGYRLDEVSPTEAAARLSPRPLLIISHAEGEPVEPGGAERILAAAKEPKAAWTAPIFKEQKDASPISPAYAERVLAYWRETLKR